MLITKTTFWTQKQKSQLKTLWSSELSTSEIAKKLGGGITKNAVVGQAYRMGLQRRASPIPNKLTTGDKNQGSEHRVHTCSWIEGDHIKGEMAKFCGQPIIPGKSYCRAHYEKAYVKSAAQPKKPKKRTSQKKNFMEKFGYNFF